MPSTAATHRHLPSSPPPFLQSLTSPQKLKAVGEGDDMAAVINDGLELYARELQQVRQGGRGRGDL